MIKTVDLIQRNRLKWDKLVFEVKDALRGRKLILVSNREPYIHEKIHRGFVSERSKGGLVSALDPMMQACKGTWIAWGATAADFEVGIDGRVKVPPKNPKYTLKRIRLSEEEVRDYYRGFSNQIIWPLFHLFKPRFNPKFWDAYRKVNRKFATAVLKEMNPRDMIWINDYHLSLIPRLVRERAKRARISFFWHIPWISWESFSSLPWRREVLEGMLGADLIGFHTKSYVKNFIECVRKELGAPVKKGVVKFQKRKVRVREFPVGIDYSQFANPPKAAISRATRMSRALRAKHIILSIDRLDYTKGIRERLEAFERFLEKYPHFRGEVVLLVVVTPSRIKVPGYREMKEEIDRYVGHINGRFQRMDWIPIQYFYRTLPQDELLAFYRVADVALITPLMDGMNLISKEYAAAREDGTLILSEFVGAADQLKGGILVNPYDRERLAGAIKGALKMSTKEKRRRSKILRREIKRFDVYWWLKEFFREWNTRYD